MFYLTVLEITLGVFLLLFSIAIVAVVLFQEGQEQQVGAVAGGADTFLEKNKSRSADAFLERWTKFIAIGFMISVIAVNILSHFKII